MSYTHVKQEETAKTVTTYGVPELHITFEDILNAERYLKTIETHHMPHESFYVQAQHLREAITRYHTNPAE